MGTTVIYRIEVQGFGDAKRDLEFLTTSTAKLNVQKRQLNTQHTAAARAITAETGSMEGLRAQTALLRQQANQMRVTNEQEARSRDAVIRKVRENTIAIRDHDRAMSGSNTLVGEYSRGIMGSMKSMGGAILGVGSAIAIALKFVQALASMIKTTVEFEASMSNVKAVSRATSEEFERLTKSAIALGGSTKFTASEVAGLQFELAKLGFTASEIIAMTAGILDLAAATGTDLAEAAAVAGATLRQFGLDATEMYRVVDVMTLSFSRSALDMQKFADAMKTAGPVAAAVGESIESTTAKLSVLANRGLDASTMGTSLRNIFIELQKEGLSFDQAMDKIQGSTNKATTAFDLFGKRSAVAGLILAENRDEANKLADEYEGAAGSAREMATVMQDNVRGSVIKLSSAWEGLTLRINNTNGALKIFLDGMTTIIGGLGTKGEANLQMLFDDTKIKNFNDRFMFFISLGHGYNKAAKEARVNTNEETQAMKDKFVQIGKERDAYIKAKTDEKNAAEAAARAAAEAELAAAEAAIEAEEKRREAYEKAAKAEADRIKKGEEQRTEARLKAYEKATADNKAATVERLGLQDSEHQNLMDIKEQDIDIEKAKQDKITELTKEGANRRKLTYKEEQALQQAALDGLQKAANMAFENKKAQLAAEMQAELTNENLTEQQRKEIRKKYAREQQKIDIKQAIINAALGITKTFVQYGFTPAGIVAAAALAIESAFQIAAIKSQKFASGGRISGGTRVTPDSRGDDTLIVAKQGEVVLNERHQALLGGASTFRRIGVPGFAEGGVVGAVAQSDGSGMDLGMLANVIAAAVNDKRVVLSLQELSRAQDKLGVVLNASEL